MRRTRHDLAKAEARAHILEGLKIALDHLDEVVALIRRSASPAEARAGLMATFALSEIQAQAILDMRLQRLTGLERDKILEEYRSVLQDIARFREILASERLVLQIIKDELGEIKQQYGDPRLTEIVDETRRDLARGHDRRGRHGGHHFEPRLHQAQPDHPLPQPAARRQGRDRHGHARGRLRRAALRGLDAPHLPLLQQPRQGLLVQVLRHPAGRPPEPRQGHRQPAQPAGERDAGHRAGRAGVRAGRLRAHGHAQRAGEEDRHHGLQPAACGRHHRHQPARGRRADRRAHHGRHHERVPGIGRRQGDPLPRVGRAPHRAGWPAACAA